jgi:hypothetical protein
VIILPAARAFLGAGTAAFNFANPTPVAPGTPQVTVSSPVMLQSAALASITGGLNAQVSANGSTWGLTATIPIGGTIYARSDAPGSYGQIAVATVTVGGNSRPLRVASCIQPTFIFADAPPQIPGSTYVTPVVATGTDGAGTITVSGGTPSKSSVAPYDSFSVSAVVPSAFGGSVNVTVTLLGYIEGFALPTQPQPTFVWGSPLTQTVRWRSGYHNNTIKFSGIAAPCVMTAVGAPAKGNAPVIQPIPMISRDGANWATSLTLDASDNGNWIAVEEQAPEYQGTLYQNSSSFTLTCGTASLALGTFILVGSSTL